MEVLLFILFMLFSIVSSLLERRKRKRELESAREAQQARAQRRESGEIEEEEEEEEATLGWPFGGGKDPFEDEVLSRRFGDLQRLGEGDTPSLQNKVESTSADAASAQREQKPAAPSSRQRVSDVLRERASSKGGRRYAGASRRAGRWTLDAQKARDAIVYAEILGPPKGMRDERS